MDIAQLGLEIRSDGVVVASNRLRQFNKDAGHAERSTQGITRAMRTLAPVVAAAMAAFSFTRVTQTIAGFEQSMASVAAITGATGRDLESLRDIAKELGATTEFSASQAADGLRFLGMAGFSAAESIQAIPDVLNLATAASMDLASAADITSNVMGAFGIAAQNAAEAADVMALASSRANTDVSQLGNAMAMAGPVANSLGISINDTAAAIGALSDLGIQGSQAGTGLRRVMSSLIGPTGDAKRAIEGMGLTVAELNPEANDLIDIVDRLREANISAAEAFTIFGDRGAPAILALVENNSKLRELTRELGNAEGAAAAMAETMRDNLQGDLQGLNSAIEGSIIALGEAGLTDALRTVVQFGTEGFRLLAENGELFLTVVVSLSSALGAYAIAAGGAAAATGLFTAALAVLTGPAGLLALAVGGLVAFHMTMGDTVSPAQQAADAISEVDEALKDVTASSPDHLSALNEAIRGHLDAAKAALAHAMAEREYLRAKEETTFYLGGLGADALDAAIQRNNDELKRLMDLIAELEGRQASLRAAVAPGLISGTFALFGDDDEGSPPGTPPRRGAASAATSQLNAYQQMTKAVNDNIDALNTQRLAFDLGETAAVRFTTAMELLRAAEEAKIPITSQLIEDINSLADAYALAEERTRQLQEQQQLAISINNTLAQGFTNMFTGLVDGSRSAVQAIGDLLKSLGQLLINQAFMSLFGGGTAGGFGGFLSGIFPGFANGTNYAPGGLAWVGERGPELVNLPRGSQVIPHQQSMAMASGAANSNQRVQIDVNVSVDGSGNIVAVAKQVAGQEAEVRINNWSEQALPLRMRQIQSNPRKRAGGR
ncbi:phage tail tape measure protein [Pelagibacterium lentulum]|uniref:Phage tail tape measure protein domain-containing protein n=1 Tax=Pelagibacterium lentulum TaxID=2029865 RepID=A0A916RPY8_9HYPH|nr:phage tail tape measure protein [Pelagibacterium lentulum]GGA64993.1 hypothetical protein GCM10011499_39310 [Pelagibacterium lentulum]